MTASPFFSEFITVLEVDMSEYTLTLSVAAVALGTVTALCAWQGCAEAKSIHAANLRGRARRKNSTTMPSHCLRHTTIFKGLRKIVAQFYARYFLMATA
jgi:hypothetical protein